MKLRPILSSLAAASVVFAAGPAATTPPPASPVINEFVANHVGTDSYEFVEIFGGPVTDYASLAILHIEGDGAIAGLIDRVYAVGTTDAAGFWSTGFLNNMLENGTMTLLLVDGFSGAVGNDLDANNDGVLDVTPFTAILDAVAVSDGGAGDWTYGSPALTPAFAGGFTPGGASRIPDGTDSDAVADWARNDFDGAGLPGFTGTPATGEAINTPGASNYLFVPPADPVINEFVFNHDGTDTYEYVELYGEPGTDYSHLRIVAVEGDGGSGGIIDNVYAVGSTDAAGYWTTGFLADDLENGSTTLLLVEGFFGAVGQDLDINNDGTFDVVFYARLVDDVGVKNGNVTDLVYSPVMLSQGYDGNPSTVGGASRLPNGTDTDAVADWVRNDFAGEGLPGFVGTPALGEALNTPGSVNMTALDLTPPSVTVDLNRTVLWPPNHKMVEVCATVTVLDDRDPAPTFVLTSITSSEPDDGLGDGHTRNDVRDHAPGTADICFSLRAERQGGGDGRQYVVVYTATDAAGNTSTGSAIVLVPHDQSGAALASVGFAADGASLVGTTGQLALVIPSARGVFTPGPDGSEATVQESLDAANIDPHLVYLGTSRNAMRPEASAVVDVTGDHLDDLVVYYSLRDVLKLASVTSTDPAGLEGTDLTATIGLHYETPDGAQRLVADIFALGAPVNLTSAATEGTTGEPKSAAPAVAAGLSIQPNPFNPSATISFDVASPARVVLRVFDVRGASVRTLLDRDLPAGRHDVRWDGRDEHGRAVASGVYFVRYESAGVRATRRALLLK